MAGKRLYNQSHRPLIAFSLAVVKKNQVTFFSAVHPATYNGFVAWEDTHVSTFAKRCWPIAARISTAGDGGLCCRIEPEEEAKCTPVVSGAKQESTERVILGL